MSASHVSLAENRSRSLLAPPAKLTVSQWADNNRHLSRESSSRPGQYHSNVTPYMRAVMDAFSDPEVTEVVMMSSAQVGKTTILENVLGYHIDVDPGPLMLLLPTLDLVGGFATDRLNPMIRDTPAVKRRVVGAGSRVGGNTKRYKKFFGGHLTLAGANSAASLASRPIRILLCDEIDRYELNVGGEGDPLRLAAKRTTAFWNAKVGYISTPKIAGTSRIAALYADSDQNRFCVPCPHCGEFHQLLWENLKWLEGEPGVGEDGAPIRRATAAWFVCPNCEAQITEAQRREIIQYGEWQPQADFFGRRGFWIWQGYSPFRTLLQTANEWLSAIGRPEQEQSVKNLVRGETWQISGEVPDWEKLRGRIEAYKLGTAPLGVLFLTGGCDVQKDRLELAVWGWGRGRQRWLVDYIVIDGDTSRPEVWLKLEDWLAHEWQHVSGTALKLLMTAIDSQYETSRVYEFARRHGPARVIAVAGRESGQALLWQSAPVDYRLDGKKVRRALRPYLMNASMAKSELYSQLRQTAPEDGQPFPPGWVHFCEGLPDEFFRQITAETLIKKIVRGYAKHEWVKLRERNEALDTANQARMAAEHLGLSRFTERNWLAFESMFCGTIVSTDTTQTVEDVSREKPGEATPVRSFGGGEQRGSDSWLSRYRRGNWSRR